MKLKHTVRMLVSVSMLLWSSASLAGPGAVYGPGDLRDGWFMRDWLLCGPFPNPSRGSGTTHVHDNHCAGFFRDYLAASGGESKAHPQAGDVVAAPGVESRAWSLYTAPHDPGMLQFRVRERVAHAYGDVVWMNQLMTPCDDMVAYAACEIHCDKDENRLFGLGTDDGVRLWLNGPRGVAIPRDAQHRARRRLHPPPAPQGRKPTAAEDRQRLRRMGIPDAPASVMR